MSQRVDLSSYYTKRQADTHFLHIPPPPTAPTLAVAGSGVVSESNQTYAYVDILITDPTAPPGCPAVNPYIQGYLVEITYSAVDGTRTKSLFVPHIPTDDDAYRLSSLPCGVTLTFEFWSVDFAGQRSATSATGSVLTAPDNFPPATPAIVVEIEPDGPHVVLTKLNNEADFNYYSLLRRRQDGVFAEVSKFVSGDYLDQSVPVTDYYYYQVQAFDLSGNFSTSNEVGPILLQESIPQPPVALDLSQGSATAQADGSIVLSFPASPDITVVSYHVWRQTVGGDGFLVLLDTFNSPGTSPITYTDVHAIDGVSYVYNVTCIRSNTLESVMATTTLQATADRTIAPSAPAGVEFSGGLGLLNISWTGDAATTLYGVSWRFAQVGDPGLTTFGEELLVQTSSLDLRGLLMPTTGMPPTKDDLANEFEVRVRASDGKNWSAYNTPPAIITYPELTGYQPADSTLPPAPVTLTVATPPDGSTQLLWTTPNVTDLWGYQVEQWDSISQEWTTIAPVKDILPGNKSYSIVGLEPYSLQERSYRFRVRTLDNTGNLSELNLLENPSFDGDLSLWAGSTEGGAVEAVVTDSSLARNQSGSCLRSNWAAAPSQRAAITDPAPYTASVFVRSDVSNGTASLQLNILDIYGRLLDTQTVSIATSAAYQRLTVTVDASPGAAQAAVVLLGNSSNPTQTFLWDDVQLEQLPFASPYGYGVSPVIQASANGNGPADYPGLKFTATAQLGAVSLRWNNPTTAFMPAPGIHNGYKDYINGTFQIFRANYAYGPTEGAVLDVQASNLWVIEVDELGDLDTGLNTGTPLDFALADASGATAWSIVVASDGAITTSPVTVSGQPLACLLVTPLGSYWVLAVTAQGELIVVSSYIKIGEILASVGDNAGFDDLQADELVATTWYYKLRAVDRFGNVGAFLNGGAPISATTLTIADKGIANVTSVSAAQTAADSALTKIGAVTDTNGNLLLKNVTQVSDITTTTLNATQPAALITGMTNTLTTHGNNVLVIFNGLLSLADGAVATLSFRCDGVEFYKMANLTGSSYLISMPWLDQGINANPSSGRAAGVHTYQIWWSLASGTSGQIGQVVSKSMQVIELG